MKNKDVISMFIRDQEAESYTKSLTSKQNYLYSYSLKIAKNVRGLFIVYPATAKYNLFYSNTTSRHVSSLLKEISDKEKLLIFDQREFEA